jgi:hypothetical protein
MARHARAFAFLTQFIYVTKQATKGSVRAGYEPDEITPEMVRVAASVLKKYDSEEAFPWNLALSVAEEMLRQAKVASRNAF